MLLRGRTLRPFISMISGCLDVSMSLKTISKPIWFIFGDTRTPGHSKESKENPKSVISTLKDDYFFWKSETSKPWNFESLKVWKFGTFEIWNFWNFESLKLWNFETFHSYFQAREYPPLLDIPTPTLAPAPSDYWSEVEFFRSNLLKIPRSEY